MNNREKVIKGVHDARRYLEDREWVDKSVGVHIDALNDVLALLKEQEPILSHEDADGVPHCGSCGCVQSWGCNYCDHCGKPLTCE